MTQRNDRTKRPSHQRASQLAAEIRGEIERTKHILAASQSLLATYTGTVIAPPRISPPDALCAVFDALLAAARHVAHADDPELFVLIERALLHAGAQIEWHANASAAPDDPVQ